MFALMHSLLIRPTGMAIILWFMLLLWVPAEAAKVRVKDICNFQDKQEVDLLGYGLIVGLDGSGDGSRPDPPARAADSRPGQRIEAGELAHRLHRAIESLPPAQRAVFALYATGEMTYGEIAESLGVPIGTVMSRLHHARRRLYELLPDLAAEN